MGASYLRGLPLEQVADVEMRVPERLGQLLAHRALAGAGSAQEKHERRVLGDGIHQLHGMQGADSPSAASEHAHPPACERMCLTSQGYLESSRAISTSSSGASMARCTCLGVALLTSPSRCSIERHSPIELATKGAEVLLDAFSTWLVFALAPQPVEREKGAE